MARSFPLLSGSGSPVAAATAPNGPSISALRNLPDSSNAEAARLESEALTTWRKHDLPDATSSLYRAVTADPNFTRAWLVLGGLLLTQHQVDAGMDAFHKAMEADPTQPAIPKALGWSLMAASQYEEAVPVWQDYVKAHPDDLDGPLNLGKCLLQLRRYPEAAAAYEVAAETRGDRADLQASLASAYLLAGEREKAAAVFVKLAELDPEGQTFNDAAYEMANADVQLPLALDYAKKAVRAAEDKSDKITLTDLKEEDLKKIEKLASYWDTLGWVNARMSTLEIAGGVLAGGIEADPGWNRGESSVPGLRTRAQDRIRDRYVPSGGVSVATVARISAQPGRNRNGPDEEAVGALDGRIEERGRRFGNGHP
jgi:tetratricopeptide (TPR) repeat protein